MATSNEKRTEFSDRCKPIKAQIKAVLDKEKAQNAEIKANSDGAEIKKLALADMMLSLSSLYMAQNTLSVNILNFKNNDALNDARKIIYKALIYVEDVVSNFVDCPYADLEPRLATIASIPIKQRYYLVRKFGLTIKLLADAFGDNSKWKWTFVEIRGRFVVIAKNLLDMKQAAKDNFDPNSPDYETSVLYIRLIRKLLDDSAMDYRDKYELGSRRADDMKQAVNLLIAARRVAMALSDNEASEEIKKKAVVWKNKLDADMKSGASK